jgi:hypothetical protein
MNSKPNTYCWIPTLDQVTERVKHEILCYVASGIIPPTVKSFSELHDHIDANCLGGFCEDRFADALIEHFGGRDKSTEAMPDGMMNFMNSMQAAVDTWIAKGGLLEAMTDSLKLRIANLLDQAPGYVTPESGAYLTEMDGNLSDLAPLGITPSGLHHADPARFEQFPSALHLAAFSAQLHLALIEQDEARAAFNGTDLLFDGSTFDVAMGNLTHTLGIESGVDQDNDGGYCIKATQPEIVEYNLDRIKACLNRAEPGSKGRSKP